MQILWGDGALSLSFIPGFFSYTDQGRVLGYYSYRKSYLGQGSGLHCSKPSTGMPEVLLRDGLYVLSWAPHPTPTNHFKS